MNMKIKLIEIIRQNLWHFGKMKCNHVVLGDSRVNKRENLLKILTVI